MSQEQHAEARRRRSVRSNVVGLLATLVLAAVGAALLVTGVSLFKELSDARRRPEVTMTVASCGTARGLRLVITTCHGTVAGSPVQLSDAPRKFAAGAVVNVRCAADGTCTAVSFRNYAGRGALIALGLLGLGAGLGGSLRRGIRLFAPARGAFLHDPRLARFARAYCFLTGTIAAAGYLGRLLS
ncbi:hypothetical protein [Kitasatospora sp. NPDC059673]|uniref:hypothetical protein n=1 Tax=Kitasatospora sp. NPDC059673 TaxID=3346901 RepID=UPI0036CAE1AB